MRSSFRILGVVLHLLLTTGISQAEITGSTEIVNGLTQPLFATTAPGDPDHMFIVEKGGDIEVVNLTNNTLQGTPFLSVAVDSANEGGLLGMAFHPNYADNGKFYVYATIDNGNQTYRGTTSPFSTHVQEYTVSAGNPLVANPTAKDVLTFFQPQANHNGGWIGFGPDGYLYIASGDGGNGNDGGSGHTPVIGNAQDLYIEDDGSGSPDRNLMGKMLRIDVNSDAFPGEADRNYAIPADNPFSGGVIYDDEIWSYGLRNPFRASFDRQTGDLWIGDVGQGTREEIDFQPANSAGGENYGWRSFEGNHDTGFNPQLTPGEVVAPIFDYPRSVGTTVTGGYVYRGPDPDLRGLYVFGDYGVNQIWTIDPDDPQNSFTSIKSLLTPNSNSIRSIGSFAEDADGNLYALDLGGHLFRIDTDIQLAGDYDGNGTVEAADYLVWRNAYGLTGIQDADGNGDEVVDAADYTIWRDNLGRALPPLIEFANSAPEPTAALLLLFAAGVSAVRPKR